MGTVANTVLDHILALQMGVSWAGEGRCEPSRLCWWDTDVIDEAGGGDLFTRLLPRSHLWASLQAAREAARRVDEAARRKLPDPDSVRTLFHFGFDVDEQLSERLLELKRGARSPLEALEHLPPLADAFAREAVVAWLTAAGKSDHRPHLHARELKGPIPEALELRALKLASALVPFPEDSRYPTPFFRLSAT